MAYDELNRMISEENGEGDLTTFDLDANGNTIGVTNGEDETTSYTFNARNQQTAMTNALDAVWSTAYDSLGRTVGALDPAGYTTAIAYYLASLFVEEETTTIGGPSVFHPDALLRSIETSPACCDCFYTEYDAIGEVIWREEHPWPTAQVTTIERDLLSRPIEITAPNEAVTTMTYTARGWLDSEEDDGGHLIEYGYDAAGNMTSVTASPPTLYDYDAQNRLVKVTDPELGETEYAFDVAGRLISVLDSEGNLTGYQYDNADRLIVRTDPLDNETNYQYDDAGRLVQQTDRNGRVLQFEYDDAGRRTAEIWLDEEEAPLHTIAYVHDAAGRIIEAADEFSRYGVRYSVVGIEEQIITDNAGTPGVAYLALTTLVDGEGRLKQVTDDLDDYSVDVTVVTEGVAEEANEIQQIEIVGPAAGRRFSLAFDSEVSDPIPSYATADVVQAALEALSTIGAGNVEVTGGRGGPWTVEFVGDLAMQDVSLLVSDPRVDFDFEVATENDGGTGINELQTVEITGAAIGPQFSLSFGFERTAPLSTGATALAVEAALEALPNIGAGNISVIGDPGGPWSIEFVGDLAEQDLAQISAQLGAPRGTATYNYFSGVLASITYSHNDAEVGRVEFTRNISSLPTQIRRSAGSAEDAVVTDLDYDSLNQVTSIAHSFAGFFVGVSTPEEGVPPESEVQTITLIGAPSVGTLTLDVLGEPVEWDYDATPGEVEDLLEALDAIDPGDVIVTEAFNGWDIAFAGQYLGENVALSSLEDSTLNTATISHGTNTGGGTGQNEEQYFTLQNTFTGQFTITFDGQTTSSLAHDASAAAVDAALEALSNIGSGDVSVSRDGAVYTVEFTGGLAETNVPEMTSDDSALYSGVTIETTHAPVAAINETQLLEATTEGAGGRTFTITFDDEATDPIASDATASEVESALEALSNIGSGNISVTGDPGGPWTVEFIGDLAAENVSDLTTDASTKFLYDYNLENELTAYSGPGGSVEYAYDDTHQLTGATGDRTESYSYDTNGNRVESHLHDDDYETGDNNRLLSDGLFDYAYDNEGNRLTRTEIATGAVTTYSWDYRNRLVGVTIVDAMENVTLEAVFTYDVFNNLIIRSIDADGEGAGEVEVLSTVYHGDHPWADSNADAELLNHYLYGDHVDEIMGRIDADGVIDWYLTDNIGSVRQIADADGNILGDIDYDSFGRIVHQTAPTASDRFTFTAREWESAVDLYFYRARWYDSADGQFISEDPIHFEAPDANLRRYVLNAPTNSIDPTGWTTCSSPKIVKYEKPSTVEAVGVIVAQSSTLSPRPQSETVTDVFECVRTRDVQVAYTCTQRYGFCWLSTRTFTYLDVFTQTDNWRETVPNIALLITGFDIPMSNLPIGPTVNIGTIASHNGDKARADQICKDREKLHPWTPYKPPATTPAPF